MSGSLGGKVVAIIGRGTDLDRAIAVAIAEAGADIAIATESPVTAQEFATASIANEIWAIGREQCSSVLDARNGAAVAAFGTEVRTRLGRADALVFVEPGLTLNELELAGAAFAGPAPEAVRLLAIGATAAGWAVIARTSDPDTAAAVVSALLA